MEFKKAKIEDIDALMDFYGHLISSSPKVYEHSKWKLGVHPSRQSLLAYIEEEAMYYLLDGDTIAGALAIADHQEEGYKDVCWKETLEPHEVCVPHLLGVNPDYKGRKIGRRLVDELVHVTRTLNKRYVRLDTLAGNYPAQHLYKGYGFTFRGEDRQEIEDYGMLHFYFFEYELD